MSKKSYQKEVINKIFGLNGITKLYKIGDVVYESSYPIYDVSVKSLDRHSKKVFVSAGVHGDEPAGVYALLEFLDKGVYNYIDDFSFIAFPCLNPSGFENNKRENSDGIDINRNFNGGKKTQEIIAIKKFLKESENKYSLAIDMHEDNTNEPVEDTPLVANPKKFYMYEVSPDKSSAIGHKIIHSLEKDGVPVCKSRKIYYDTSSNGVIWSCGIRSPRYYDDYDTLEGYMQKYTKHLFTTETPTHWSMKKRIETQLKFLEAVLNEFRCKR